MSILFILLYLVAVALGVGIFFGLPYYLTGGFALAQWKERAENRVVAGVLVSAALCVVSAPLAFGILISGGSHVHLVAQQIWGMSWAG